MQVYEVAIEPTSDFGTPLVGDTLFGHLCWRFQEDPGIAGELRDLLQDFTDNPFLVVSDSFSIFNDSILLPKPTIPLHRLDKSRAMDPKSWKKLKFYHWDRKSPIHTTSFQMTNQHENSSHTADFNEYTREHNTINRLTGTTGEGFAPYSIRTLSYPLNSKRILFIATRLSKESVTEALVRTGHYGYGKDASTGLGRFTVNKFELALNLQPSDSSWNYTLGVSNPKENEAKEFFMEPVTRFGKLGGSLANHGNPFKNPILYAATSSLFSGDIKTLENGYRILGRGLKNVSTASEIVAQGASLAIPLHWEKN